MKKIVNLLYLVSTCCIIFMVTSCEKQFLEKPTGSDLNIDSIFATRRTSLNAIAEAYSKTLAVGFPFAQWIQAAKTNNEYGLLHGTICDIADETYYNQNWAYAFKIISGGMTADNGTGAPFTEDAYTWNWSAIRASYLTLENIKNVSDMTETEKEVVRAEMKTIIAYRYQEMLKRYGGIPIVSKALTVDDDYLIPRGSIEAVVDSIAKWCDESVVKLPNGYSEEMIGRVTKGAALSIKAETFMFAARPLFNSSTPYLSLGGENDKFICYGNYDANRWQKAIQANLDVLDWAAANGHYLINTGNPIEDYGVATSDPGNPEIILAYKSQHTNAESSPPGLHAYFCPYNSSQSYGKNTTVTFRMLKQYRKADGTDAKWVGPDETKPFTDYYEKCDSLEPRFKASIARVAGDALNNPGDLNWKYNSIGADYGWEGCGTHIKFWAKAGSRNWMEFPIYRLAENYLNLAEAYNEVDNPTESLRYLNIIRQRAGIPNETETNKDALRSIIQREWAVEFFQESHRLYDIKHWKIAPGIMGSPRYRFQYSYVGGTSGPNDVPTDFKDYWMASYVTGFWSPNQYLVPFPVKEINKGYLVQNPGY